MKIVHICEGEGSRILITGPFWQLNRARRIAEAGLHSAPVRKYMDTGLTFQITLYGANRHVLRAYKAVIAEHGGMECPFWF